MSDKNGFLNSSDMSTQHQVCHVFIIVLTNADDINRVWPADNTVLPSVTADDTTRHSLLTLLTTTRSNDNAEDTTSLLTLLVKR